MTKPSLVLCAEELDRCVCYDRVFSIEFSTRVVAPENDAGIEVMKVDEDAAIICLCSATTRADDSLLRLAARTGHTPTLVCSTNLDPDFVMLAARHGADHFLSCEMDRDKIISLVEIAVRHGGLRGTLESWGSESLIGSAKVRKMIIEITRAFPLRQSETELATRLAMSTRWVQKTCRQVFGLTFVHLMRRLRVYQALRLMAFTSLDNGEIALQLHYGDETSLARDFRKELDCSPTEAHRRLINFSPQELFS